MGTSRRDGAGHVLFEKGLRPPASRERCGDSCFPDDAPPRIVSGIGHRGGLRRLRFSWIVLSQQSLGPRMIDRVGSCRRTSRGECRRRRVDRNRAGCWGPPASAGCGRGMRSSTRPVAPFRSDRFSARPIVSVPAGTTVMLMRVPSGPDAGNAEMGTGAFQHNPARPASTSENWEGPDISISPACPSSSPPRCGKRQQWRHPRADNVEAYSEQRDKDGNQKKTAHGKS